MNKIVCFYNDNDWDNGDEDYYEIDIIDNAFTELFQKERETEAHRYYLTIDELETILDDFIKRGIIKSYDRWYPDICITK